MASQLYTKLPKNTIRLLRLEPGNLEDELRAEFDLILISKLKYCQYPYTAISYRWIGDFTCQVYCKRAKGRGLNYLPIKISSHLADGLVQFRDTKRHTTLWIDAICINQRDKSEKATQIPLMGQIYERATQVWVWFGAQEESTPRALELLKSAADYLREETGKIRPSYSEISLNKTIDNIKWKRHKLPEPEAVEEWMPLEIFYRNSWFTRIWVLQEILLAIKATLLIGSFRLDWADICAATNVFLVKDVASIIQSFSDSLLLMSRFSRAFHPESRRPILDLDFLLDIGRYCGATEPKDRVFAVLGLANVKSGITVDNKMTLPEVYAQAVKYIIRQGGRNGEILERRSGNSIKYPLEVLNLAGLHAGTPEDFPSWVMPWMPPISDTSDGRLFRLFTTFTAGGNRGYIGSDFLGDTKLCLFPDVLNVQGILFDQVCSYQIMDGSDSLTIFKILGLTQHLPMIYKTGESRENALLAVLTTNWTVNQTIDRHVVGGSLDPLADLFWEDPASSELWKHVKDVVRFKSLFTTDQGYIGLGPRQLRRGDQISILFGARNPHILRPVDESNSGKNGNRDMSLLGPCYVHGLMNGEALKISRASEDNVKEVLISII
ncbi:Heterokaryon incompatibility protein (HET) domain containing protein [Hyaloscypha variabilis]